MHFVDADHPDVIAFAKAATAGATTDREKAVALFYAVRDGIRYDPYTMSDDPETYRASNVLRSGLSYCIPKSVLLCAAARAVGFTARLGFADVRNHLNSESCAAAWEAPTSSSGTATPSSSSTAGGSRSPRPSTSSFVSGSG